MFVFLFYLLRILYDNAKFFSDILRNEIKIIIFNINLLLLNILKTITF